MEDVVRVFYQNYPCYFMQRTVYWIILILFYCSLKPIKVSDAYKVHEICKLYCLQSNCAINAITCMKPSFACTLHSTRTTQTQRNHNCNGMYWTQHNPMQPNSLQHKASQKDPTHSTAQVTQQAATRNTSQHTQHNNARHHITPHTQIHTLTQTHFHNQMDILTLYRLYQQFLRF